MPYAAASIALAFWWVPMAATAQSDATSERRFVLPDHGHFVVRVPREWKDQLRQPPNRLPPTIGFSASSGQPFQVLVTTIWPAAKDRAPLTPEQLRAAVERAAQRAKAQAVESELPVVEFKGRSGPGFYFSATDRAPKPGEYLFMTQGMLRVGELSVTFTILTNPGQDAIVRQALDALKGAMQEGV